MKSASFKSGWKRLQLVLAVLLPLHAGLAQAAMMMPAQAVQVAAAMQWLPSATDSQLMTDAMPCHHEAGSPTSTGHPPAHNGDCCDAGNCHCVAVCGLTSPIARVGQQRPLVMPRLVYLSVPAAARPPDLRPPIR